MKTYFVFKENSDIIMVDVKEKILYKDYALIDTNENKVYHYTDLIFGSFIEPIRFHQYANKNFKKTYFPLESGGYRCDIYRGEEMDEDSFIKTKMRILDINPSNNFFIELQDDDAARLWIEAMRGEYADGGDY